MIPATAIYQSHKVKFFWKDPDVGLEQVCLEENSSDLDNNLFFVPLSGIFGSNGDWFFEKVQRSLELKNEILTDMTELSEFRICNGIIEIKETDYGNTENYPSRYGLTYIDVNNLLHYCEKYELCQLTKSDQIFYIFCFHS
jgi:hypothetical protein